MKMPPDFTESPDAPAIACIEPLEERCLLSLPWGTFPHLIGQDAAFAKYPTITGQGESIVVIDSGVDYMHPQLGGGYGDGFKVNVGWDFTTNTNDPMDDFGHGTGVAGILGANQYVYKNRTFQGIAPGANIIALRVVSQAEDFNYSANLYEQSLRWVINHRDQYNIVAVNVTDFGGAGFWTTPHTQTPFSDELATLNNMGVFLAGPDGNELENQGTGIKYPAADPNMYAVGASNSLDQMFIYGQRGVLTDMVGPGERVVCPYYAPATGAHQIIDWADGTSFATPHITGAAALIKQINPRFTPAQIMSILQDSGVPIVDAATGLTFKRLNLLAALDLAYQRTLNAGSGIVLSGGMDNSMVFDKTGRLHLAYFDATPGVLHYITRAPNGLWDSPQTVGATVGAGKYCSIAVDGDNIPGIAYYDPTSADLMYAQFNGATWETGTVDSYRTAGLYPSLAYDAAGWPVITYYNKTSGDLKLAAFNGTRWNTQTLQSTGDVGRYSSLKLNPATGRWAVSYIDVTSSSTKYGLQTKSGWAFSTVDITPMAGGYTSLAFDKSNQPAFSYYDAWNADLKFAHYQAGRWNVQTVASKNSQGLYTTLLFNPIDGKANIVYYYRNTSSVMLATGDIGSWQITTAASGGGTYAAGAMTGTGAITLCYLDTDASTLHVVDL